MGHVDTINIFAKCHHGYVTPGWVEVSVHNQPKAEHHPERKIVYVVAFHPRRSSQAIPHVDQSWLTSSLSVKVRVDGAAPQRVYLAPEMHDLPFTVEAGYACVQLPPVGAHAVIVLE